jgi:citrate lyase beta subunit
MMDPVTFLFVPAHDERKVANALEARSDAVVLDLEDSVPDDRKAAARAAVRDRVAGADIGSIAWVRVNAVGPSFHDDVTSIDWSRVAGAVLPKAEDPSAVAALERAGAMRILLLIESATGLEALPSLVRASHRVARLAIGTWDLALDLGLLAIDDPDDSELIWQIRGEIVVRSRALGLKAPLDGIYAAIADDDGLRAVCTRAFRLGYGGKLLVHPRQVSIARSIFEPDSDALQRATETISAYDNAAATGRGAIRVRGRLVDRPMVDRARALVARATRDR